MKKKEQSTHLSRRSGFTLIEIILVVVIIGILASIAIPRLGGRTEQAKIAKARNDINAIAAAVQIYEMNNGAYPSSLDQLLDSSKSGYPFLQKEKVPLDPWDKPYVYAAPGAHNKFDFDLSCTAPQSGVVVNNWE